MCVEYLNNFSDYDDNSFSLFLCTRVCVCVCRCQGVRVQLCGVVCSVSPVLEVSDSTFFILILKDPQNSQTLPVLVQVRLYHFISWKHNLCCRLSIVFLSDDLSFSLSLNSCPLPLGDQLFVVESMCVCGSVCVCDSIACVCGAWLEGKPTPLCDQQVQTTHPATCTLP